jgi:hypothetical protein
VCRCESWSATGPNPSAPGSAIRRCAVDAIEATHAADALRVPGRAAVIAAGRVAAVGLGCTWHPGFGTGERLREPVRQLVAAF